MQYFASQLRAEQESTHSLRAAQYKRKRKAKPGDDEDAHGDGPEHEHESATLNTRPTPRAPSNASFASPEIAQLRVAGLLPEEDDQVPAAPFPHAPARTSRAHHGAAKAIERMAALPAPLYPVHTASTAADSSALRRTHLDVLSTILHRCLLEADFGRAGRAWGMILRTQIAGGHPVDVRNNGRWGVGAEILLHHKPQANGQPHTESTDHDVFSEEGFELAREYYERLIVQHPNRRTLPNVIDERTFYPAMFSLWIYEVHQKSKYARQKLQTRATQQPRSTSPDSVLGHMDSSAQEDAIQVEELARAMEIADRLDRLVVSPPFDKQANLLQIRGHVGLWVSDLIIGKTALAEDWDMDATPDAGPEPSLPIADQQTRMANSQRELQQAQAFFRRAEMNGARGQTASMASIDFRLKQIARKLEELRAPQDTEFSSLLASEHHMSDS